MFSEFIDSFNSSLSSVVRECVRYLPFIFCLSLWLALVEWFINWTPKK